MTATWKRLWPEIGSLHRKPQTLALAPVAKSLSEESCLFQWLMVWAIKNPDWGPISVLWGLLNLEQGSFSSQETLLSVPSRPVVSLQREDRECSVHVWGQVYFYLASAFLVSRRRCHVYPLCSLLRLILRLYCLPMLPLYPKHIQIITSNYWQSSFLMVIGLDVTIRTNFL